MKRIVLMLVILFGGLSLSTRSAEAQRSGSLQATARVVDTRTSWSGLVSAHQTARRLAGLRQSADTVETALSRVSVSLAQREGLPADRPRTATITIEYLRN